MNSFIEKCKNTRILGAIGIIGLVLGAILPYAKYRFFGRTVSISLWRDWEGIVIILLAIANFIFIFKDLVKKYVPALFSLDIFRKLQNCESPKVSLIPTIFVIVFTFFVTSHLDTNALEYHHTIGFYAIWIGNISLVAYPFLYKKVNNFEIKKVNNPEIKK